ncbi:hypothetical protein ZIOFF_054313 [Zingiber officinale]|uniref:Importin N-terminal domain-containing protein n=1 Tax=Zingiber officinale TaxID=94328 RepID=A0A8J5KJC9_ZINOF|nr:hypothetical protein ZIOFF_054313 [Zingiber officinale]
MLVSAGEGWELEAAVIPLAEVEWVGPVEYLSNLEADIGRLEFYGDPDWRVPRGPETKLRCGRATFTISHGRDPIQCQLKLTRPIPIRACPPSSSSLSLGAISSRRPSAAGVRISRGRGIRGLLDSLRAAMDLASLTVVLRTALSPSPEERKVAEESLNQFQHTPQHLVRLLLIIVDGTCDMGVRQVASIHFKNFVAKYWSPHGPGEPHKVSESDKNMVRENILGFIVQVPPLLRFKSDEERTPLYLIIEETFPLLLNVFSKLVQVVNPTIEVADLIKLICKIFWSSIYLEIPRQLFDPSVFGSWMILFLNILERPVPLEGQLTDPEVRKSWGWFGDVKLQRPESKAFAQMFQKNYAGRILGCYLQMLNAVRIGEYLPDRVINLLLQYLGSSIPKNSMYQLLQPQLDIVLFEIVFPLMCFNDNDQKLWSEDPHEYVRKGYDIIEDLYSPRTAAMDFVSELMRKRGKANFQKFIQFIVDVFRRYDEAVEFKPFRQKDGALLAIGTLCDKLKKTEPYKSELERMLTQHVLPEFTSPIGHLRAKAAWVAGQYANINFSDQNIFRRVFHCVIAGFKDPELPVRVDSVFALRAFVEACVGGGKPCSEQALRRCGKEPDCQRGILLLDEFFKLMNEVENEDLVLTLETIVDRFGEEMAPYAFGLCQNLASAFWRCLNSSESDDDADDSGALAAVGCLRAISTILESVNRLPHLFVQIEPTVLPILQKMLTTDGQDVFEEVLDIVLYLTFYSPTISLEMWSLWPLIMDALSDWAIDFFDSKSLVSHQVTCEPCSLKQSYAYILVPLDKFISRGTSHFLTCKDPDYQQSLWKTLSSIMSDPNIDDADIEPVPKLIEVVFQNCKGQVDHWVEPYLRITIERLRRAERPYLKCLLIAVIADAFYYNPVLTLGLLHKLGVAVEVFNLWFQMLQEVKKSGLRANFRREHDKKVCCLGLTSVLGLPADQLPGEAFERVFKATLDLLVSYKDQIAAVQECNPARFQNLTRSLDFHYQALASGIAQHAEQRKVEIEKEKLEKASSK